MVVLVLQKNIYAGGNIQAAGELRAITNLSLGDNVPANFGADDDMVIRHTGNNAFITNATGSIEISTAQDVEKSNLYTHQAMTMFYTTMLQQVTQVT